MIELFRLQVSSLGAESNAGWGIETSMVTSITMAQGVYEQSLRDPAKFSVTWELVPGRGAFEKATNGYSLDGRAGGKIGPGSRPHYYG